MLQARDGDRQSEGARNEGMATDGRGGEGVREKEREGEGESERGGEEMGEVGDSDSETLDSLPAACEGHGHSGG